MEKKIPIANNNAIGPRLLANNLSDPQPATRDPINPPTSKSESALLAETRS